MSVLFVADLAEDLEVILSFTPSNDVSRKYDVYESFLGSYPVSTYWTNWGGWYDNIIANQIELYIGGNNLIRVYSLEDCCTQSWSIYNESTAALVYINVPKYTWLYNDIKTNFRKAISFLSGPKNPNNPSDDVFNNEHWPIRLETPKFTVKLSDVVNGLTKYSTFDYTLYNNDGYFDDLEVTNFFNAPSYIRKTWKENPKVEDFITIRYGMVETIKIDDKTMTVSCADLFRTLEEPVCKVIKDVFPDAIKNTDENLPVVYGTVSISLIEIDDLQYVAGENITDILNVYDKDGNAISWNKDSNFIITTTTEAKYAIVIGNTNNRIGQIITDIISSKTNIKYISSFWDLNETDIYKNNSSVVNITFTDGTVRDAVKNTLISDIAFLIQKNDGRFTLREWGKLYNIFNLSNWEITKFPVKNYAAAQKNYLSSCIIKYNYDFQEDNHKNILLYNEDEDQAETTYNKLVRREFKTYLINKMDVFNLGKKLSDRFSILKETIQVYVGQDTSEINLLDIVELEIIINNRKFSKNTTWIVKEIDPAQDVLTLEPIYIIPFVAISTNNKAAYSTDGINWTETELPGSSGVQWMSVTYGNEKFVAISYTIAAYSTDGINWTETTLPSGSNAWYSVTYGNGKFVIVSYNNNKAAYSFDGINWTETTLPGSSSVRWMSVTYGNEKFVAVSYDNNRAIYSTDGINWTETTLPGSQRWMSVTYGNEKFVAVSSNGSIGAYSTDGINWTETELPYTGVWYSVTYGNGKFVAISQTNNRAIYSTNGINWTEITLPISQWWMSVTYKNNKFVIVSYNNNKAAYSFDGINWTETTLPSSAAWRSVT